MTQEKTTVELIAHSTMYVGIKKITKKNAKLFNQRLKILRFAGLHIFDALKFSDIQDNIGLTSEVKPMTPKEFKNIVWQSREEGAQILIKSEQDSEEDTPTPTGEVLDAKESEEEEVTLIPDL